MKRVVVTGMGAITPLGNSVEETWGRLIRGESGIDTLTRFDCSDFSAKTAAQVKDFHLSDYLLVNERHRMDRFTEYAVAASIMAIKDSKLMIGETVKQERIGVSFGTAIGGIEIQMLIKIIGKYVTILTHIEKKLELSIYTLY